MDLLIDEDSLWMKKHREFLESKGLRLCFVGGDHAPRLGSSDDDNYLFAAKTSKSIFTSNGKDYLKIIRTLSKAINVTPVRVFVCPQDWTQSPECILATLLLARDTPGLFVELKAFKFQVACCPP